MKILKITCSQKDLNVRSSRLLFLFIFIFYFSPNFTNAQELSVDNQHLTVVGEAQIVIQPDEPLANSNDFTEKTVVQKSPNVSRTRDFVKIKTKKHKKNFLDKYENSKSKIVRIVHKTKKSDDFIKNPDTSGERFLERSISKKIIITKDNHNLLIQFVKISCNRQCAICKAYQSHIAETHHSIYLRQILGRAPPKLI